MCSTKPRTEEICGFQSKVVKRLLNSFISSQRYTTSIVVQGPIPAERNPEIAEQLLNTGRMRKYPQQMGRKG